MLEALLRPRRVVHAHCDRPCGIYDPSQARVEAESVMAIQTRYQGAEKVKTAGESVEDYRIRALAIKPSIVVANLEEGTDIPEGLPEGTVGVYASIEAETAEMDPSEARALLDEFGVREPGLETVIRAGYRAIDLITFLSLIHI